MSTPASPERGLGVFASLAVGVGAAVRHLRVVLLVYGIFLALALVAAWPAWTWWSGALAHAIDAERLLGATGLPLLKELVHYDRTAAFGLVMAGLTGSMLAALLLNPLVAGGLIGVLLSDARPSGPRFFETGARWYGPLFRALVLSGLFGLVLAALVTGVVGAFSSMADERGAAMISLGLELLSLAMLVLVAGATTAVLDVARIHLVRSGSRRAVRAVLVAVRFVARRLPAFLAMGAVFLVGLLVLAACTIGLATLLPGTSWVVVLATVVLHQVFAFGRTALRTAILGTEMALMPGEEVAADPARVEPSSEPPVVLADAPPVAIAPPSAD